MLQYTQFLIFELGNKCNMDYLHPQCPVNYRKPGETYLTDELIVSLADQAYNELGFTGLIGWHFYNEPMLQAARMLNLIDKIKVVAPQSRFVLWTNGTILVEDSRFNNIELVYITNYDNQPKELFSKYYHKDLRVNNASFDNRLKYDDAPSNNPCLRPFIECIIDAFGELHLCCQDWDNRIKIGNVHLTSLKELSEIKLKIALSISKYISNDMPVCHKCNGKIGLYSFDNEITARTYKFLESIN